MSKLRDVAYQIDPALWVRQVLGVDPTLGKSSFCAHAGVLPLSS